MASALDGITVLELSHSPAGAIAGMFLCDHGARVIRLLDSNAPATRRGGYLVWDRGKACRQLDLSQVTAEHPHAAAYEHLIRSADVVLEDFPPSSDQQTLMQPDWLAALNPRLIHCSITAYGKHGPLKDEPAIDELVMARMGILATMPGYRPGPVHVVHPLPSIGAALFAAIGIAAGLLAREKTGRGRTVETSLMAGSLLYHPKVVAEHLEPRPFQTHPAGSGPFYSVYACGDGNWVQLGCVHLGFIQTAAKVMGIADVLDDPRFGGGQIPVSPEADRDLRARIAEALVTQPYAHWAKCFEDADVPFALARTTEEGLDDPQVQANGMVKTLTDPEVGPLTQMGVPVQLSRTPGRIQGPRTLPDAASPDLYGVAASPAAAAASLPETEFDLPLKDIRVLEITNLIAGPIAGRLLADLGADVIKVEPHAGDISRPLGRTYFFNVNVNKRSLCLNTREPDGKAVAQKVAATADVMLANLRPGATARMGLGPDDMRELNPRLIETHVTGFGATGPYAHRPGIDPLSQALMGLSRAQGGENPPVFPAQLAPTDYTAGAMGAYGTILALFVRERTGVVQRVDTNLLNGGIMLTSEWFTRYADKPARHLADKGQYGLTAFHRLYELKDGWLYVAADTPVARQALCEVLGCETNLEKSGDLPVPGAGEGHPSAAPPADALAQRFAALGLSEAVKRLQSANVPCAPVVDGDSNVFLDDPHAIANRMVLAYEHPVVGHMLVAGHYVQFGNTAVVPGKPTPLLGQHIQDMLREVGYTDDAIADLYGKAVVKTEDV